MRYSRLNSLTPEQKKGFIPVCPDFVIELRSSTDRLADLHNKMREYIDNGSALGLLIDVENKRVYVCQSDKSIHEIENPEKLSAGPLLPGFELDLREIW